MLNPNDYSVIISMLEQDIREETLMSQVAVRINVEASWADSLQKKMSLLNKIKSLNV